MGLQQMSNFEQAIANARDRLRFEALTREVVQTKKKGLFG